MEELKELSLSLEEKLKYRWKVTSTDNLIEKERVISKYLSVKSQLACIQFYRHNM